MAVTFHLVLISWILFRARSVQEAWSIFYKIVFDHGPIFWNVMIIQGAFVIILLLIVDLFHWRTKFWNRLAEFPIALRVSAAVAFVFAIVLFGIESQNQFIYFQF